jgi:predicted nuclease of predicted toxin-antitoxin system
VRLLVDMNLTPRWVPFLQNAGHDVVHWSSVGRISAKDGEICDYAREHAYVLLTNDLDFPRPPLSCGHCYFFTLASQFTTTRSGAAASAAAG